MSSKRTRNLIFIAVLLIIVIYTLIPTNPGVHMLGINRDLQIQEGLDLTGGLRVLLEVNLPSTVSFTQQDLDAAIRILQNRANALGVSEVNCSTAGQGRVVCEFPGAKNITDVVNSIQEVGQLAFVPLGTTPLAEGTQVNVDVANPVAPADANGQPEATAVAPVGPQPAAPGAAAATATPAPATAPGGATVDTSLPTYRPLMTGAQLESAGVATTQVGKPYVSFTLKSEGAKLFADYTTAHVGEYLAIVLDGRVISSPVINGPIDKGQGMIEGSFTVDSANVLATQLRYGALPVPFKIAESRQVGATLGQDSVRRSVTAGLVGMLIIILFMGIYYRLPGIVADAALLVYAATTFAIFIWIPVTLTLPGIAGFVLSIGVAVDANVLIFSRLKEELRAGRPLHQAIDLAWSRAWPSIRDSNISTLITCVILFVFGSAFGASLVKGFALTLALGVFVSLFTAITVTRTFLHLVLDNLAFSQHPRWFLAEASHGPVTPENNPKINIIGKRYLYFGISLLVIIPGILALIAWGLPLAIDFTGGSMLELQFSGNAPQPAQIVQLLNNEGIEGSQVQSSGSNVLIIRMPQITEETKAKVVNDISNQFNTSITINRFDTVGPTVSQEVARSAGIAVAMASLGIIAYITFAFRGVPHAFRFGTAAIIAMLHDVLVVLGIGAILGHFLHWEIDSLFLTALLTVIGFSVHDTIVVFDRIRENLMIYRRLPFDTVVNHSIVQTLDRSINTQLTVMLTLLALALFGGVTLHTFVITLLIGVFSGTYSSIFNASPILVVWENREWRNWFRRPSEAEQKA